jgi:hypothetical protein
MPDAGPLYGSHPKPSSAAIARFDFSATAFAAYSAAGT